MWVSSLRTLYDSGHFSAQAAGLSEFASCQQMIGKFRTQRNMYLSGFSLLVYFVMRRTLILQTQLYHAREHQKATPRGGGNVREARAETLFGGVAKSPAAPAPAAKEDEVQVKKDK